MKVAFIFSFIITAHIVRYGFSVPCEDVVNLNYRMPHTRMLKTCLMNVTTFIDCSDTIIPSPGQGVEAFDSHGNKKLAYLPGNFRKVFPDLAVIDASDCSIKAITKTTFNGLTSLKMLKLFGNEIEKVREGSFDGLDELTELMLFRNKIKFIDSHAFVHLTKVDQIDLRFNVCLDEYFASFDLATMPQKLAEKCGHVDESNFFDDAKCDTTKHLQKISRLMIELEQKDAHIKDKCARIPGNMFAR